MKKITPLLFLLPLGAAAQTKEQPNILFIAIDDLNDWVGFLGGHPQAKTPNLDRLANMGMVFENAYCAAPVSNASRGALLSGLRTSTTGVYGNAEFLRDSPAAKEIVTLPKYFSNNGYFTTSRGKIFHHPLGPWSDPQSWDKQAHSGGKGMNPKYQDGKQANGLPKQTTGGAVVLDWAGVNVDEKETNDYLNAEWAASELLKKHETPFFMACGIFRPHLPWYVPQKYFDRFPIEEITLPEGALVAEEDVKDIPNIAKKMTGYNQPDHEYHILKKEGMEKEAIRAYLACISYADDCIGVIVDALEKSPNKENTIVVLWGDHGWHLGEKMRYRKFSLWERSCKMPLIIVAPGVTQSNARCSKPVNLLDLYPTLVDLAGLPKNKMNEGVSLYPLLKDPEAAWENVSITTLRQNEHSIRSEHYRYIIYRDGSEELYDHSIDPLEFTNQAKNPSYEDIKQTLKKHIPKVNVPSIGKSTIKKTESNGMTQQVTKEEKTMLSELEDEVVKYNNYILSAN